MSPGDMPPAAREQLIDLARRFKARNPHLPVLVHSGACWFRDEGRDYAVWSWVITGKFACTVEGNRCFLHMPSAEAPADALVIEGEETTDGVNGG